MNLKLTKENKIWIAIAIIGGIIIYSNRGNLFAKKDKLSANSNTNSSIDNAIEKLKLGQVKVNEMPDNVRKELSREV